MFVSQPQKSFDKFPRLSFMGGGGSLAKNVNRLCDPKVRAKLSQINVRSDNNASVDALGALGNALNLRKRDVEVLARKDAPDPGERGGFLCNFKAADG